MVIILPLELPFRPCESYILNLSLKNENQQNKQKRKE